MEKNEKSPNTFFNYTVITLLLGAIFFFIHGLNQQRIDDKKTQYELQIREDSLLNELTKSREQRATLFLRIDSLSSVSQNLSTKLTATKQELSSIKGKYKAWTSDSLAQEMNRRAGQ